MDHYCVFGNPVGHSKSPAIHARFAELTGQDIGYTAHLVALDGFAAAVQDAMQQGLRGCNVTVPFKLQAFELSDHRSARAELAQAANTLVLTPDGIEADNTDGAGLVNDIQSNLGLDLQGLEILLAGAGGAAAGVLGPLLATRPSRLVVSNRTFEKAQALVDKHLAHASLQDVLQGTELVAQTQSGINGHFDVVINATTSSLGGGEVPIPAASVRPGALAYDMMYGTAAESFSRWATACGAVPRDGLGMLVEQAAEAFFIWRGVRPPSSQVLTEMRGMSQGPSA